MTLSERLESEFKKEGAEIEQVQKMDKRQFSYAAGPLDAGFYVNFISTQIRSWLRNCVPNLSSTRKFTVSITSGCARGPKRRSGRKSRRKSWRVQNKSAKTGAWPVLIKLFSSEI